MISLKELNPKGYKLDAEQELNLKVLLTRINIVRKAFNKPMIVTSGFRSREDHAAIYAKQGLPPKWGSLHLKGAACDILDNNGELWEFCINNLKLIEDAKLWLEDKSATPTWVHFQIFPPKSGKIIFKP